MNAVVLHCAPICMLMCAVVVGAGSCKYAVVLIAAVLSAVVVDVGIGCDVVARMTSLLSSSALHTSEVTRTVVAEDGCTRWLISCGDEL
jgi:hypothetical protein